MNKTSKCMHVLNVGTPTWDDVERKSKDGCYTCQVRGPNMWLCLHSRCFFVGCGDSHHDHAAAHHEKSYHPLTINMTSRRIWCYLCETEVLKERNQPPFRMDGKKMESLLSSAAKYAPAGYCGDIDRGGVSFTQGVFSGSDTDSDNEESEKRPRGLTGLQNLGNTCYLNAALQCLSNCPPLTQFFLYCSAFIVSDKKPLLSKSYMDLINDIWHKKRLGYVVPSYVVQGIKVVHPMFRGYSQQDTQEFLRCFMDQLHEELKEPIDLLPDTLDNENCNEAGDGGSKSKSMTSSDVATNVNTDPDYGSCDSGVSSQRASVETSLTGPTASTETTSPSDCTLNGLGDVSEDEKDESEKDEKSRETTFKDVKDTVNQSKQSGSSESPRHRPPLASVSGNKDSVRTDSIEQRPSSPRRPVPGNSDKPNKEEQENASKQRVHRSVISDVFDGRILSSVQCLTCERVSCTKETFQDLSLPIPTKDYLHMVRSRQPQSSGHKNSCTDVAVSQSWMAWMLSWMRSWFWGPTITLQDCLAAFFSADELKGDNMYSCEKCKKLRNGVKYSKVLHLPEILCIHLKRFRHEFMFSTKITSYVQFPVERLDMKPYLHKDCQPEVTTYDLIGVICHHGTAGGGHYTAYAQNNKDLHWYEYDDQYVTQVDYQQVENCEAYVLFYRKTSEPMETVRAQAQELAESKEGSLMRFYVSKQWINKFNTFAEPGPITNKDFLCRHGCVHPEKYARIQGLAQEVNQPLWQYLHSKYGGGPSVNHVSICTTCQLEMEKLEKKRKYEFDNFLRLNEAFQSEEDPPIIYAISMAWFKEWEKFVRSRNNSEPPGPIDNRKICYMKSGVAFVRLSSDYGQLSATMWKFLYDIYGGGPEIVYKDFRPLAACAGDTRVVNATVARHTQGRSSESQEPVESNVAV